MDMCENLLTRGYLYECNSTYIWMLVAIIIFMFIMTTVAVILIIGKIKQKHKQKEELNMSDVKKQLSQLLNIDVHGQDDANKASFSDLEQEVAFELKKRSTRGLLAKKLAHAKYESAELEQLQQEVEIVLEAIDIEQKKVDLQKLTLLATRLGQPVECILIEQAPACISYIEPEESCSILSALKQEEEAYDLLVEAGFEDISDLSELPFVTVDQLIQLYADFDVTEEVKYITGKLVILQLKGKVRKSKRQEYLELLRGMTAELSTDDYVGLSEDVDDFKAAKNALHHEQQDSNQQIESKEVSDSDHVVESEEVIQTDESDILDDSTLILSPEDNAFIAQMFEDVSVFRFKIREWKIVLSEPIDFEIIGTEKTKELLELAQREVKTHQSNPSNFNKMVDILSNILERF